MKKYRIDWQMGSVYILRDGNYYFLTSFNSNEFNNDKQIIKYIESLEDMGDMYDNEEI